MKTRDPVPPRPPRLTRARAAQAAATEAATAVVVAAKAPSKKATVAGPSLSSKEVAATSSKTSSKAPSAKASSTTTTAAASEIVVVGPSTAATVTTTSPITSAITTSTSTSNTPAIITTTTPNTVAAALANTTFTIIIRQPPPIPDPPKPLDLDTLVARRVEAAASAGSASAPALGEEDEEEDEGEDDDITEEEETEDTGAGETREKTTKKKKTTTTTAAELSTPEAAAVSKLLENFIFVCPNCFDSFRSEKDLATHKYVVHQVASYVCSYYAVPAPTLEGEGAGTGTARKTSKDGGCDFVTQDVALFKKHEAMHLKPPAHFCAICLDPFDAVEALTAHITAKHGTFACYVCGLVLPNRALHSSHMVSFHKEAALKCEVCSYKTYLKSPFERHVRNHRQYKPCTVEGCNEAFSSEERLEEHIARLHRNVRQHRCERCAEERSSSAAAAEAAEVPLFYSLKRLQKHLVEVHGDSMLLCDRCDFKAANRRALVLHSRSGCSETLNYRPYRCTVNEEEGGNQACQAAFRTEARLRAHMAARHTAERRFPCPEENCDRRFRSALQLGRHQRDAHPADVEVVETTEVDDLVDLAYLNELLGGRPKSVGSLGGGNAAATSAGALYAKPFRCRSDGCGAHFGLRTELIKHERSCFFNKRRASAAVATASTPSTSRKSTAAASSSPAAKGSRGRPKGSSSTSTPSSSFSTTSNRPTSRAPKASTSSKAAAAAAAAEAMAVDEAATAIDSLMMMRAAESGGGHSSATATVAEVITTTSSQGNSSTELITTEVISLPMEHLGEHQYITTRYHV